MTFRRTTMAVAAMSLALLIPVAGCSRDGGPGAGGNEAADLEGADIDVLIAASSAVENLVDPDGTRIELSGSPGSLLVDTNHGHQGVRLDDGSLVYTAGDTIEDDEGRLGLSMNLRTLSADGADEDVLVSNAHTLAVSANGTIATVKVVDPKDLEAGRFQAGLTGELVVIGSDGRQTTWSEPGEWYALGFTADGALLAGLGADEWEGPQSVWEFTEPMQSRELVPEGRILAIDGNSILYVGLVDIEITPPMLVFDTATGAVREVAVEGLDLSKKSVTSGIVLGDRFVLGWENVDGAGLLSFAKDALVESGSLRVVTLDDATYAPIDLMASGSTGNIVGLATAIPSTGGEGIIELVSCEVETLKCAEAPTPWKAIGSVRAVVPQPSN